MAHFLFTLPDGGGVSPPVVGLAGALVARGHDVRVLADPVLRPDVEAAGARFRPWTRAPHRTTRGRDTEILRDWEARTPAASFAILRDEIMVGPADRFAEDVLEELAREPADAIATETVLFGTMVAAEHAGVPLAVLSTTVLPLPVAGRPPFGPGFQPAGGPLGRLRDRVFARMGQRLWDRALPRLNEVRAGYGLPALGTALDQVRVADRILVLTCEAFELPADALPENVRYTGPRLTDPAWAGTWTPPPGEEPLVLVSLSSSYQGQERVLSRAVEALGTLSVRGVATLGPSLPLDAVRSQANVQVVASAPHAEVLDHAAAVVSHGGHGTVIKALAHGVPLVVLPMGRDQLDVAARVVAAGAGLRLRPGASPARIAAAVQRVLVEPGFRESARRLAAAIAADVAAERGAAELEGLAVSASDGLPAPA
jgi:MGT family glycosyltransferase